MFGLRALCVGRAREHAPPRRLINKLNTYTQNHTTKPKKTKKQNKTNSTHLGLVMEYVAGGNMADYILKTILLKFGSFDSRDGLVMEEDEARYFFKQIVSAVQYCHENRVAHRCVAVLCCFCCVSFVCLLCVVFLRVCWAPALPFRPLPLQRKPTKTPTTQKNPTKKPTKQPTNHQQRPQDGQHLIGRPRPAAHQALRLWLCQVVDRGAAHVDDHR